MTSITHVLEMAEREGRDKRAVLEELANQPDAPYNNTQMGQKQAAIRLLRDMDKPPGQHDIDEVKAQLHQLLQPPLFVGATPTTPFRIATLVNNEIAQHSYYFNYSEKHARPLLERWFTEHPQDIMEQPDRRQISITAMRAQLSSLSARAQIAVLGPSLAALVHSQGASEAIELFELWTEALPPSLSNQLKARVQSLIPKNINHDAELAASLQLDELAAHQPLQVDSASEDALQQVQQMLTNRHPVPVSPVTEAKESDEASEDGSGNSSVASSTMRAIGGLGLSPAAATDDQLVEHVQDPAIVARQQMTLQLNLQMEQMKQMKSEMDRQMEAMRIQMQSGPQPAALPLPAQSSMNIPPSILHPAPVHHASSSPAAGTQVPYGEAKAFLTQRFQSQIIHPLQQEVTGLRAQLMAASGEPDMNDPAMKHIQSAAMERFRKPGGIKLFDRRALKLVNLEKELQAKELIAAQLVPDIARLRLECRIYSDQVNRDKEMRGESEADSRERVIRWKEDNDRRDQAKRDRLKRDQEKLDRANRPIAASAASSNLYRSAFAQQYAPAAAMVEDEVEDDEV